MTPITLNDAMMRYESQRIAQRSKQTQMNIRGRLENFRQWVTSETQPNVYLDSIDDMLVSRYFLRLLPPAYSEASFNVYRGYIVRFFEYCRDNGWITTNPCRFVDKQTEPEGSPKLRLSASELLTMLGTAHPRNRAALALGMNTGLRSSEVKRLTVGDVNLTNDTLAVYRPKTKTYTIFPITSALHEELIRWFNYYATSTGHVGAAELPNTYTLIPPMQGIGIYPGQSRESRVILKPTSIHSCPEKIVQVELVKLGYPIRLKDGTSLREGFHTLRRSAGRAVFDLAVAEGDADPIRVAMAFLGHKNQKTTEIYLGIGRDEQARDRLLQSRPFLERVAELDAARILASSSPATTTTRKVARSA